MLQSVEGIAVPGVHKATADDEAAFSKLFDKAYNLWLKKASSYYGYGPAA